MLASVLSGLAVELVPSCYCAEIKVFSADMQSVKAEDVESLVDLCMSANTVLLLRNLIAELYNRIYKQE